DAERVKALQGHLSTQRGRRPCRFEADDKRGIGAMQRTMTQNARYAAFLVSRLRQVSAEGSC
ncbi:MAG TPA: hypothetical protein PLK10_09290, partial [Ottowia sp.]|nr:hypothetical protein [Ottowia sp.]